MAQLSRNLSGKGAKTVILVLIACAQAVWLVGEYGADRSARLERLAQDPNDQILIQLRHESESAQRHLSVVRNQAETVLKERVRERVDEAVAIAHSIHAHASGLLPPEAVKVLVRESLRPQRFFAGRGYYFIDDMQGHCILLPTVPRLEGTSLIDNRDDAGRFIMRELIRAVSTPSGGGYVRYSWYPPNVSDRMDDKIAYARQFQPYGWLIGTGDYVSAVEDGLKADALERLRAMQPARGGRLVVLDQNAVIRLFPDYADLEGKRLDTLADGPEKAALQILWDGSRDGGGEVMFQLPANGTGRSQDWIGWTQTESAFNWVVAATASSAGPIEVEQEPDWISLVRYVLPVSLMIMAALWAAALARKPHHDG